MKIFAIANQKGGVGKTTCAVNLAAACANKGIPTLLVDLDPQGNATSALGIDKIEGASLLPVFAGEADLSKKIIETGRKNLDLVPAEIDLATLESDLREQENFLAKFAEILAPIKKSNKYAAIFVDCPPALGILSLNALSAADCVLIALQCEFFAVEGLSQILDSIEQIKKNVNRKLTLGGIILTMFDVRTNLSKEIADDVAENFKNIVFKAKIPRSIRLAEAPSLGKTIFEYDENGSGARAFAALAKETIRRFDMKK